MTSFEGTFDGIRLETYSDRESLADSVLNAVMNEPRYDRKERVIDAFVQDLTFNMSMRDLLLCYTGSTMGDLFRDWVEDMAEEAESEPNAAEYLKDLIGFEPVPE